MTTIRVIEGVLLSMTKCSAKFVMYLEILVPKTFLKSRYKQWRKKIAKSVA